MRTLILVTIASILLLVIAVSSLPKSVPGAMQTAPKFSSSYTSLTRCGSGMTKKEEREADERGTDIPSVCKGPDGYKVDISYSACASSFRVRRGEEDIPLGMQSVDWKQKTAEWRLANGKPFAIIIRIYEYAGNEQCNSTAGKITSESLLVKGLKGFEHIEETVKAGPNANVKARELADKGYLKPKS